MSIEALGNLDIWADILQYFRISLELDSDAEIKEKRQCLLRVALLSPSLTAPALDLLWQDMTSLVPVTQVISSGLHSRSSVALHFSEDNGGFWKLTEAVNSKNVRERAYEYLTRIRHLRLSIGPPKEMGAGSILSMALSINPLLPKLKSLYLDFRQWNGAGTWAYAIGTLISPSLTSISYTAATVPAQIEGIRTLQFMFSSQSLALSSIVYRGQLSSTFLGTCVRFRDLEVLKLSNEPSNAALQRATSVSIATIFEKFQNLVDLEIDLRLLPLPNRAVTPPPLLRKLSIAGKSSDIGGFISWNVKSSSLQSLTVVMFEPPNLAWKMVCDTVATNFPHLHSLSFRRANPIPQVFQQMMPQDLSSLISRAKMRSFELHGISHCFTETNISGLLSSWPDLRTFSITDDYNIHFSASLLIQISRADHLQTIKLPLDLTFLQEELPDGTALICHSRITELTITSLTSSIPSLEGKIRVAKNLLTLFPSLERIFAHSTSSPHRTYLTELEELLRSFRSIIVTYLHKRETKRRLGTRAETA